LDVWNTLKICHKVLQNTENIYPFLFPQTLFSFFLLFFYKSVEKRKKKSEQNAPATPSQTGPNEHLSLPNPNSRNQT
jgi:hypothetical protein